MRLGRYSALMLVLAAGAGAGYAGDRDHWRHRRDREYRDDYRYDRDRDWGRRGGWQREAYSQGLRDGRFGGEHDRARRHSFRPTKRGNYKDADRGYHRSFGDKDYYKQMYRNGYIAGYRQGYRW